MNIQERYGLWITIFITVIIGVALLQYTSAIDSSCRKCEKRENYDAMQIVRHYAKNGYTVFEIYNILTPEECQQLIQEATNKGLEDSQVWSYGGNKVGNTLDNTHRRSKQTWFAREESAIAKKLSDISVALTNIPIQNQELVQVAMYEKEGKFNAHFDACSDEDAEYCEKMNNYSGQRKTTLLVYLNEEFSGGETEFIDIGISIKPKTGNAILFINTFANEEVVPQSIHRAQPVLDGYKWIATVWSHSKEYKGRSE